MQTRLKARPFGRAFVLRPGPNWNSGAQSAVYDKAARQLGIAPSMIGRFPVPPTKTSVQRRASADREVARSELIARKLAKVAPDEDPAHVAGAIAIFATETIKRSASNLREARAYLDGLRDGIDGLLRNAFPEKGGNKKT